MKNTSLITCIALACTLLAYPKVATAAPTLEWIDQFGTSRDDISQNVSADDLGNVYISGYTWGNLGGTNAGGLDAFVSKHDASGTLLWTKLLGTNSHDYGFGVAADGLGNVYISGYTAGSLEGTKAGGSDAFVSKYDADGTLLWIEQLGSSKNDSSLNVSADSLGNVYITGYTLGSLEGTNAGSYDAFVSKYDTNGTLLWTEQLGTSSYDYSRSVSTDGLGNVYISGYTAGSLEGTNAGGTDAFVSKYDVNGTLLWIKQLGSSSDDESHSVSADGLGNVYISGITGGSLGGANAGGNDAFVSKYDANGTLLWTEQLGSSSIDNSQGVSADGLGNVYISGVTSGNLGGTNTDSIDAFVSKYDTNGTLQWTEQLGSSNWDVSYGVSADGLGNIYISGITQGNLEGDNAGSNDVFIAKFSDFLSGDFDEDLDVDADDLLIWKSNFGMNSGADHMNGDADSDGDVDGSDFLAWQVGFSGNNSQPNTAASVPEPQSVLLTISFLLMALPIAAKRCKRLKSY